MTNKISTGVSLYVFAWLVFANFDFDGSDTVVAYQLRPTSLSQKHFPKMIALSPTTYRISGQIVVGQTGRFEPMKYTDCAVIDIDNWTCAYDDKSGKFGFRGGDYYTESLDRTIIIGSNIQSVSRFGYVWNNVKWNMAEDSWIQKATVLITPFFL